MAEVLSKTSVFSSFSFHHHRRGVVSSGSLTKSAAGFRSVKLRPVALKSSSPVSSGSDFYGRKVVHSGRQGIHSRGHKISVTVSNIQMGMGIAIGKSKKWWEKGLKPNMKEVQGAQDLVDSLLNAGDKLVVVNFFSPGCGGCKALHPKICQFAEMNPEIEFFQVNYEEHKSLCYSLNVHVLPFFRFFRGAHGRVCSFSCTNATIKKFRDALAKHSPDRCSIEPVKGLEEKELLALAANKDLNFNYEPKSGRPAPVHAQEPEPVLVDHSHTHLPLTLPLPLPLPNSAKDRQSLVSSSR